MQPCKQETTSRTKQPLQFPSLVSLHIHTVAPLWAVCDGSRNVQCCQGSLRPLSVQLIFEMAQETMLSITGTTTCLTLNCVSSWVPSSSHPLDFCSRLIWALVEPHRVVLGDVLAQWSTPGPTCPRVREGGRKRPYQSWRSTH